MVFLWFSYGFQEAFSTSVLIGPRGHAMLRKFRTASDQLFLRWKKSWTKHLKILKDNFWSFSFRFTLS